MYAIYKVIFNRATRQPILISEVVKWKTKRSSCWLIASAIILDISLLSTHAHGISRDNNLLR